MLDLENAIPIPIFSEGKVGYPWESTRDIYQHIPPVDGLYNGCIEQYGVMFWEQLLGYPLQGYPNVPYDIFTPRFIALDLSAAQGTRLEDTKVVDSLFVDDFCVLGLS